jgi:hypothetical protein
VEGLEPFYMVEWIRVRPRYTKKHKEESKPAAFDITDAFIEIVQKLGIPYVVKQQSVYIYGYVQSMDVFNQE